MIVREPIDEVAYLRAEVDRLRDLLTVEKPVPFVRGLRAPFPFFGNKRIPAPLIWQALGNPGNLVIPFAGSLAELWARPEVGKVETINDVSGLICNVWRAIQADPVAVAVHADHPVNEIDLFAWHKTLVEAHPDLRARLQNDPRYYDVELAGRWIWGASAWLGSGWCDGKLHQTRPHLGGGHDSPVTGQGINCGSLPRLQGNKCETPQLGVGVNSTLPSIGGCDGTGVSYGRGVHVGDIGRRIDGLVVWMQQLSDRLRLVRVTCGDFERVVTPAVTVSHGPTGIIWDPPYDPKIRAGRIYDSEDDKDTPHDQTVAQRAARRARALEAEHGDLLVQAFMGYEGEHDFPGWTCIPWKARGGYGNQAHGRGRANAELERIWFSPHCNLNRQPVQGSLL